MKVKEQNQLLEELTDDQIPKPFGFKLLLLLPPTEEKFEGGLYKPDALIRDEQHASMLAVVLDMGPDAYKDEKRFPSGPWCQIGDTVMINSYAGVRFKLAGVNFRLVNDDTPLAVVKDPKYFERG